MPIVYSSEISIDNLGCKKKDAYRKMNLWKSLGGWLNCKYTKTQLAVDYSKRNYWLR